MNRSASDPLTVSVVVPVFNRVGTVERALRSVLEQHPAVHEVIVVDDGSTDGTPDVVAAMAAEDGRIRCLHQTNQGASAARNRGIAEATGQLVAFQDSDDEWLPGKIARQLEAREHSGPGFVFCRLAIHQPGARTMTVPSPRRTPGKYALLWENFISTQTVLVDRAVLAETPGFDIRLRRLQDWDLWLEILKRPAVPLVFVPEVLVHAYRQPDSLSASEAAFYSAMEHIMGKHWKLIARHPWGLLRHCYRIVKGRALQLVQA
ncbi:glycosyltransferase family 2 protein [Arthrobacter sulfonylureivorans]|uniref:Glycosyltransferase n=1 Tax=Arthrobacter sulfonylureivorans TaxID=2486855 RepID=A0ABY3WDQ1_9MICC|nr:glycosyltransferase family 2 protein [Arthrobacter sulfonylureivorans]UNK45814.1 glycosyltransferase [Arthrobacter sulfonylureivorans]